MKRVLTLFIIALLLAACGSGSKPSPDAARWDHSSWNESSWEK